MWFSEDRSHWNIKVWMWIPKPSSTSYSYLLLVLLLLQHYRKRMQRSKWEAPHRFNHAARISDLCKELLIYDTSCQRGRFWNNKCLRQRRARIYLDFLFLYLRLLPIRHKSHDRASWQSNASVNPMGLFQTSQQQSITENTIYSVSSDGEQPSRFNFSFDKSRMLQGAFKIQWLYQQLCCITLVRFRAVLLLYFTVPM